jgi:hypothetical protein
VRWGPIVAGVAGFLGALTVARVVRRDDSDGVAEAGPVDPFASSDPTPPGACDPTAKPGVLLFRQWVIGRWGERPGSPQNILRDCKTGAPSEHWEGRAWDWMVPNAAAAEAFLAELLATSAEDEPAALARRAGVMYLIWNHRMWRAYAHAGNPPGSWAPYTGPNPHTDHVHLSFSRAGARGETSFYPYLRARLPEPVA